MNWSDVEADGYYWWSDRSDGDDWSIVEVRDGQVRDEFGDLREISSVNDAVWFGPILPPDGAIRAASLEDNRARFDGYD